LLPEGYGQVDEIDKLCTEIFKQAGKDRFRFVEQCLRDPSEENIKLRVQATFNYLLELKHIPTMGFTVLKDFIKKGGYAVVFDSYSDSWQGVHTGHDQTVKINLRYTDEFASALAYRLKPYVGKVKYPREKDWDKPGVDPYKPIRYGINQTQAKFTLQTALGQAYRSVLAHELTHAFDAFRSKTKKVDKYGNTVFGFTDDGKSRRYYDDLRKAHHNTPTTPQEFVRYYKLPHEYWARFTQAVLDLNFYNRTLRQVTDQFIEKFVGWFEVGDGGNKANIQNRGGRKYTNAQVRLLKALADYYYLRKDMEQAKQLPSKMRAKVTSGFNSWNEFLKIKAAFDELENT
jgi:hypothetical protein